MSGAGGGRAKAARGAKKRRCCPRRFPPSFHSRPASSTPASPAGRPQPAQRPRWRRSPGSAWWEEGSATAGDGEGDVGNRRGGPPNCPDFVRACAPASSCATLCSANHARGGEGGRTLTCGGRWLARDGARRAKKRGGGRVGRRSRPTPSSRSLVRASTPSPSTADRAPPLLLPCTSAFAFPPQCGPRPPPPRGPRRRPPSVPGPPAPSPPRPQPCRRPLSPPHPPRPAAAAAADRAGGATTTKRRAWGAARRATCGGR